MSEFDNNDPSLESLDCPFSGGSAPTWPEGPSEPSQWTPHQSPVSPPSLPFPNHGDNQRNNIAPPQHPQVLQVPQHPFHNQPTQPQSVPRPPQPPPQQNFGGFPMYSQSYHQPQQLQQQHQPQQQQQQQQQQQFPQSFQEQPFSPPFPQPGSLHFKKRRTLTCPSSTRPSLRPIAPQGTPNNQFVPQFSTPPTPPPPPPKGHLMGSMGYPGQTPSSQPFSSPFLAPSLSDSETRYMREDDFNGGEMLRMIAPKPPSLPPADFHRRSIQKPPHDAVISPSPPVKRTRGRTKRRSSSKLGDQKIKLIDKERFLGGSELRDQLAILSAKCAASEAESKALKERLSATESELAELRLKVQQFGSQNFSDPMISPVSPVALSPCEHSPSSMVSPDIHSH